ncbi:MAG: caspase family protein [Verrucomicrobia bacterium]|nr:caspase family protein [Verrucomicrobiota bacterium]
MSEHFETLAKMHLRIFVHQEKRPFQWIYAVDDSWFWPSNWSLKISETEWKSVIDERLSDKEVAIGTTSISEESHLVARKAGSVTPLIVSSAAEGDDLSILKASLNKPNIDDATTAKKLIEFIQRSSEAGMSYGLCFCSFEYFWKNAASIDLPHNAVFFDLSHQLAQNGTDNGSRLNVAKDWEALLNGCDLFTTERNEYDMTRLGWYLHYALKFGKAGNGNGDGSRLQSRLYSDHILIISSAIAGDAQNGRDAIGEYLQIQNAIWTKLGANSTGIRPGHFTFAPLPKVFTDVRFTTALNIFSNSFRYAASWDNKLAMLKEDMLWLWKEKQWGHLTCGDKRENLIPRLKWADWISPVENEDFLMDLCGLYHLDKRDCLSVTGTTLCDFFRYSIPECNVVVNGHGNIRYSLPSRPGIAVLIGIVHFFHQLSKKKRPTDVDPKLMATCSEGQFTVTVTVNPECVNKLKTVYDNGNSDDHGSSSALVELKNAGVDVITDILKDELDLTLHGCKMSCKLKSENNGPVPVKFENDKFIFLFSKFNPSPD